VDPYSAAFSRSTIDFNTQFGQQLQTLSMISEQLTNNFQGLSRLLQNNGRALDNMANSSQRIASASKAEADSRAQTTVYMHQTADIAAKIQKAEQETAKTHDSNLSKLRAQVQGSKLVGKSGEIKYTDEKGNPQTISLKEYANLKDQNLKGNIRQQIAESISTDQPNIFSVGKFIQALSHGNIGVAVGEAFGSISQFQGASAALKGTGAGIAARGAAMGGLRGLATQGLGLGVGGLAGALSPAALVGAIFETRRLINDYQRDLRQGMQTGLTGTAAVRETLGAHISATIQGLNPFDALTVNMAKQIADGIMSEGFSGRIRAAWQDAVTNVVKSTGMDAGQALQLMSTSANTLGETAMQFSQDMDLVSQTAKTTSISIKTAAETLQSMQTGFFTKGGTQATGPVGAQAALLMKALPMTAVKRGTLLNAITQNWMQLVGRAHINPALAYTPQIIRQMAKILDEDARSLWRIKDSNPMTKNMDLHSWITFMFTVNSGLFDSMFPGASNDDIYAFMTTAGKGGTGFEKSQKKNMAGIIKAQTHPVHHGGWGVLGSIGRTIAGFNPVKTEIGAINAIAGIPGDLTGGQLSIPKIGTHWANGFTLGNINPLIGAVGGSSYYHGLFHPRLDMKATAEKYARAFANQGATQAEINMLQNSPNLGALQKNAVKVEVELSHNAKRVFSLPPSAIQNYYNSRKGLSGTQLSARPLLAGK
jgi:hypothetical protein